MNIWLGPTKNVNAQWKQQQISIFQTKNMTTTKTNHITTIKIHQPNEWMNEWIIYQNLSKKNKQTFTWNKTKQKTSSSHHNLVCNICLSFTSVLCVCVFVCVCLSFLFCFSFLIFLTRPKIINIFFHKWYGPIGFFLFDQLWSVCCVIRIVWCLTF